MCVVSDLDRQTFYTMQRYFSLDHVTSNNTLLDLLRNYHVTYIHT